MKLFKDEKEAIAVAKAVMRKPEESLKDVPLPFIFQAKPDCAVTMVDHLIKGNRIVKIRQEELKKLETMGGLFILEDKCPECSKAMLRDGNGKQCPNCGHWEVINFESNTENNTD